MEAKNRLFVSVTVLVLCIFGIAGVAYGAIAPMVQNTTNSAATENVELNLDGNPGASAIFSASEHSIYTYDTVVDGVKTCHLSDGSIEKKVKLVLKGAKEGTYVIDKTETATVPAKGMDVTFRYMNADKSEELGQIVIEVPSDGAEAYAEFCIIAEYTANASGYVLGPGESASDKYSLGVYTFTFSTSGAY